jgi:hypothetical protein
VGECRPGLSNSGSVGKHANSTVDLGQIAVRDHLRRLVANTDLKPSWAPINELDSALGFESSNRVVDLLGNDITTIQQAGSHVLSVAWVALHHLVVGLEAGHGDLLDGVGLMGSLGRGDNRGVCNEREVDTRVWDQVGLELVQINVERTIETKGCGDGRDNLSNQTVQVDIVGALKSKVSSADVVDSLVINHE